MKKILLLLLFMFSANASAIEWICSRDEFFPEKKLVDSGESEFAAAELSYDAGGSFKLSPFDLIKVIQGERVSIYGVAPTLCVFPISDPRAQAALKQLDVAPSVLRAHIRSNGIIERRVRQVYTDSAMEACVANNSPAIGILDSSPQNKNIGLCF